MSCLSSGYGFVSVLRCVGLDGVSGKTSLLISKIRLFTIEYMYFLFLGYSVSTSHFVNGIMILNTHRMASHLFCKTHNKCVYFSYQCNDHQLCCYFISIHSANLCNLTVFFSRFTCYIYVCLDKVLLLILYIFSALKKLLNIIMGPVICLEIVWKFVREFIGDFWEICLKFVGL